MTHDINIRYQNTLNYLFSQLPMFQRIGQAAYKANLDNTLALDKYFNYPHKKFKSIHVAGTNGKGSVSHSLAAIFQSAGYKTGLYTSPHLIDFRERIRIDGQMMEKGAVVDFVDNHAAFFEQIKPSFFELTVAMAFDYFAKQGVEVAIIEVGLGGRLDSTNIISPELCVITNIGFDHTQFLGHSLPEIAGEKAGIIKKNTPVVIGEYTDETRDVFIKKANEMNAPLYFADDYFTFDFALQTLNETQNIHIIDKKNKVKLNLDLDLLGHYQHKNILTTLTALAKLKHKFSLTDDKIIAALSNVMNLTGLMGRWQIIDQNPLTVCDTGHNAEGIAEIVQQIFKYPFKQLHIVFGVVDDKSTDKVFKLLPHDAIYYFTKASIPRALDEKILKQRANDAGLNGESYSNVQQAYLAAKENAELHDFVFIGGSTFIVADLLSYLQECN